MSLAQLSEHERQEYLLLTPRHCPPRTGSNFNLIHPTEYFSDIIASIRASAIVAVDFETKGNDYSREDFEAVGIGFAWDEGSCYFEGNNLTRQQQEDILHLLDTHKGLIAHNVYFDGGVAKQCLGANPKWLYCTYSLYSYLANEGFAGRSWGLKTAQVELLLWESSNEKELDEWLVINGYYRGIRRIDNTEESLRREFETGALKPDKGEMWRAPVDILGKYCILDAESTYQLYLAILRPALDRFPGLDSFVRDHWMGLIDTLVDQRNHGILMNRPGLIERKNTLTAQITKLTHDFIHHPQVHKQILEMEKQMAFEYVERQPTKFNKNGSLSKNWEKWYARMTRINERRDEEYTFNIQSGPQLRELLYNKLGMEVKVLTEKGEPAIAVKALSSMGEIGAILTERIGLVKELGYIEKYLELTVDRPTIHPSFRTPGTTTGRLSSNNPNMQQISKTKAMMSLFVARPGKVWVDLDFSALEPVVVTEYSQDENMMQIYGNGRPSNDIYCYVMAHIAGMEDRARALGYDPLNPTPESLARVKKEMKKERSICKIIVLAAQYGAGINKIRQILEEQEIFLSYEEVQNIYEGYWELFAQVKDFARALQYERKRNKGFILNGMGRPMAIPEEFEKDILNRFIQSTGHDVLTMYISILRDKLSSERIEWKPIVMDWHDSTGIEVDEKDRERTIRCFTEAMDTLNDKLQGTIKLKGTPSWGYNLADTKEPEN